MMAARVAALAELARMVSRPQVGQAMGGFERSGKRGNVDEGPTTHLGAPGRRVHLLRPGSPGRRIACACAQDFGGEYRRGKL